MTRRPIRCVVASGGGSVPNDPPAAQLRLADLQSPRQGGVEIEATLFLSPTTMASSSLTFAPRAFYNRPNNVPPDFQAPYLRKLLADDGQR